ncbi:MAG: hypothetical protein II069_06575 [Oscillospiraceae bacterium]|nr:hypothetical protein [Oscillospiraceae bacterium]
MANNAKGLGKGLGALLGDNFIEMGKKTLMELNESKIRYHKAESDLLQARYEYLYRCKIIEYYRNVK